MEFLRKNTGFRVATALTAVTAAFCLLCLGVILPMRPQIAPEHVAGVFGLASLFLLFFQFALGMLLVNLFVSRPLARIAESMRKVEAGDLSTRCATHSNDEFGDLAGLFNTMVRGLGEMNETRKRIEQRLIKTEESLKYKAAIEDKTKIIERMNSELTDAFNNVALLYTVSQYLHPVLDLQELVATAQKIFEEKFKCDQYALYFAGPVDDELQLVCYKGFRNQNRWEEHRVKYGQGIAGRVAEKGRIHSVDNVETSTDIESELTDLEKRLRGSALSLPLQARGSLIGVLTVARQASEGFTPTDRQSLQSIAAQIALTYDRCKLYTRNKELAVRDELTGIYNRRHFQQMLELEIKRAERYKRHVSLLMIDVDHFKKFNDTFGHLRGDDVLRRLAKLLKKNLREVDVLARYGGEEFVVMLTDTALTDATNVAGKLRELVKMNLKIDAPIPSGAALDTPFMGVTISVGVSSYPDCAGNPAELLNSADMALYAAKRKGRDRVSVYQVGALPLEELMNKIGIIH